MSVAGVRNRDSFGTVAGPYRVLAGNTGLITLVPAPLLSTIYVQKIHVQITTPSVGERWTFQDGAGIPLVPAVSADGIAHFDFNFGPDGVPCTEATAFVLNITGATGAVGWITWSAYQQLTRSAAATRYIDLVLADRPTGYWRLNDAEGYAQAVLSDAPVGYWRLGETSGAVAIDSAPTPHNGAYVGGVTLQQPGPLADGNTAALFDGATGYVDMGNVAAFNFTGAFSAEAWIKFIDQIHNLTIVAKTNWGTGAGWHLGLQSGKVVAWAYSPALALVFNFNTAPVLYSDLGWHHVVLTWDGTANPNGAKLYADGVVVAQATAAAATPGNATDAFRIASSVNVPSFYPGAVDEVAVYSYALTAQQIANHYALRTSPIATLTPAVAADSSGHGYAGTILGGVTLAQPGAIPNDAAARFDGVTGNVAVAAGLPFLVTGFSIEAWVKQDSIVHAGYVAVNASEYAVLALSDGVPYFAAWDSAYRTAMDTPNVLSLGVWHHLVGTVVQGGFVKLYVDGVFKQQAAFGTYTGPTPSGFYLGSTSGRLAALTGSIDEAALYPYVLTDAQVLAHFQAGRRP